MPQCFTLSLSSDLRVDALKEGCSRSAGGDGAQRSSRSPKYRSRRRQSDPSNTEMAYPRSCSTPERGCTWVSPLSQYRCLSQYGCLSASSPIGTTRLPVILRASPSPYLKCGYSTYLRSSRGPSLKHLDGSSWVLGNNLWRSARYFGRTLTTTGDPQASTRRLPQATLQGAQALPGEANVLVSLTEPMIGDFSKAIHHQTPLLICGD